MVGEWPLMEHWDRYANGVLMNGSRNPKMGLFFQPISSHMDWLSQKEKVTAFSVAKFGPGVRSALSLYLFFVQPNVSTPIIIGPHVESL